MKTCPKCFKEYADSINECPADASVLKLVEKDALVGTKLANRYEILSVIGKGGMGVVYKARQEIMDRLMAIKMLHSHMVSEPEAVKRFFREAKTVSQVKHHHVVTLYDFGMSSHGQPYIVMDYLKGKSLKQISKANGPLTFEQADIIFKQVVDGLAAAHALEVVHRDLKPENIVLTKQADGSEWVTLVDFGLSKLKDEKGSRGKDVASITRIGDICGSPPYMSPEQCLSSRVVDPRSDIYGLAVVIYEAIANKLPFDVKSAIEMLDCHLYGEPCAFNLSRPEFKVCTELTHVLNKALQKDPDKRQQTVEEFGRELHEALMRDSLKLRTFRHRAEVASLQPAVTSSTTTGTAEQSIIQPAMIDGIDYLTQQAQLENNLRLASGKGHLPSDAGKKASSPNSTTESTGSPNMAETQTKAVPAGAMEEYIFRDCPYCDTPVQDNVRFCLNCRRQLPSAQEVSRLRAVQGGRHGLPKPRRSNSPNASFDTRAKLANDQSARLVRMQEILKIVLALLIVFTTFSLSQNEFVVNAIQQMVTSITFEPPPQKQNEPPKN